MTEVSTHTWGSHENAGPDNGEPNCIAALLDTLLSGQFLYDIC